MQYVNTSYHENIGIQYCAVLAKHSYIQLIEYIIIYNAWT